MSNCNHSSLKLKEIHPGYILNAQTQLNFYLFKINFSVIYLIFIIQNNYLDGLHICIFFAITNTKYSIAFICAKSLFYIGN